MKFLLDENISPKIGYWLKEQKYKIKLAAEHLHQSSDTKILETAVREDYILITNDKDFADLVYAQSLKHKGIILFRLKITNPDFMIRRLKTLLKAHKALSNKFIVIEDARIRERCK